MYRATLTVIIFTLACYSCHRSPAPKEGGDSVNKLPNIIYILADDLGYGDLSCYGQTRFKTPNIDRIAASGMLFTQHYSGSTVCAPSRSSLMTGLHTGHTYIRGNKEVRPEGQFPLADSIITIAELLKSIGYTTGAFGKWGLGAPGSEGDPINQGFDEFYGYNCQRFAHHYYPRHLWHNAQKVLLEENAGFAKGQYAPYLIQERRLAFLEENHDRPFFMYVPAVIPHAELIAPDEVMDKYRNKFLPERSYDGTDEGDQYRQGPYESQKEAHAAFVAMIDILDQQVGQILDKIKELGIEESTLVIFTSDNGPHLEGGADPDFFDSNGPLKGYKRDLYEGGIRVPMLASFPDHIKAGSTSDHISAFWDILPTLTDLTGAETIESDGISMLPTLFGKGPQRQHPYLYWEFHERGGRVAVRMHNWKGVKYDFLKEPAKTFELYDLALDVGETNNLASEYPAVVDSMEHILQSCRTPSDVFTFRAQGYLQAN